MSNIIESLLHCFRPMCFGTNLKTNFWKRNPGPVAVTQIFCNFMPRIESGNPGRNDDNSSLNTLLHSSEL